MEEIASKKTIYKGKRYGGWVSIALWCVLVVSLLLAFFFYLRGVNEEGANLFSGNEYTRDIIEGLKPLYYYGMPIAGFALAISFAIVFVIGFFFGYETLMTIGMLGMGFAVALTALRGTIISVGGSVYPGPFAIGDYLMFVFDAPAIYNFIVAIIHSHFIEDFHSTIISLSLGMAALCVFDIWGIFDLLGRSHPLLALSLLFQIVFMAALPTLSLRTIRLAEKLID
jgi:hypothetical protein